LARCLAKLITFLTTIPLPAKGRLDEIASCFPYVPLVGLFEGLVLGGFLAMLRILDIDSLLSSALYLSLHALLTGCMHLDGFADYVDGIASGRRGMDMVRVMKDPRKGSFAVTWVCIAILLTLSSTKILVEELDPKNLVIDMVAVYVLSTEAMYLLAALEPEEPYEGMAKRISCEARKRRNVAKNVACMATIIASACILEIHAIVATIVAMIIVAALHLDIRRRLGFVTGDVLGFAYETVRTCLLVTLAISHIAT